MTDHLQHNNTRIGWRAGTGQPDRQLPALDPAAVAIEPRTLRDWLSNIHELAKHVHYITVEHGDLIADGTWETYLGALTTDLLAEFAADPEQFDPDEVMELRQPHRVLLLVFLQLMGHAHDQINDLPRLHLDYYYETVLGLKKRRPTPDRVHVYVELTNRVDALELPTDTIFSAGADAGGKERLYRVDEPTFLSRAKVAELRALQVHRNTVNLTAIARDQNIAFTARIDQMLHTALAVAGLETSFLGQHPITHAELPQIAVLLTFVKDELYMSLQAFERMMVLREETLRNDDEWYRIADDLNKLKERVQNNPGGFDDVYDFEDNLFAVLGGEPDWTKDGIPEVSSIFDLYEQYPYETEDIEAFIREQLFFEDVDRFLEIVAFVRRSNAVWEIINNFLDEAGKERDNNYQPDKTWQPWYFETRFEGALGTPDYPQFPQASGVQRIQDVDQLYTRLMALSEHLQLSLGEVQQLTSALTVDREPDDLAWSTAVDLLETAYDNRVTRRRQMDLQALREETDKARIGNGTGVPGNGLSRIMLATLDQPADSIPSLDGIFTYIGSRLDRDLLEDVVEKADNDDAYNAITAETWEQVYRILAGVQRQVLGRAIPQKSQWINLVPAEDATANPVTLGLDRNVETPRWHTFGTLASAGPVPCFGWAVTSPVLLLTGGNRTITLTLAFAPAGFDVDKVPTDQNSFLMQLSTEAGWFDVTDTQMETEFEAATTSGQEQIPKLKFTAELPVDAPPIVATPEWPTLRLMMRPVLQNGVYATAYEPFQSLVLLQTEIHVKVEGLHPEQLENDVAVLNPAKPFQPFGPSPAAGSRLGIGHHEIIPKSLQSLTLNIEWMGVPTGNLGTHYTNYDYRDNNHSFTAGIHLWDQGHIHIIAENAALFDATDATSTHSISVTQITGDAAEPAAFIQTNRNLADWNRFVLLELNDPDFGHNAYPIQVEEKALELAIHIATDSMRGKTTESYKVNPPYTPKLKQLTLNYTAAQTIRPGAQGDMDVMYHVLPFGSLPVTGEEFLPQFDHVGELYIGLQDVAPPQTLSLLLQLAEGSTDPDLPREPVHWHALSGNRWVSLKNDLIRDDTRSMINSGIVTVRLPDVEPSTLLPAHLYWLRASITSNTESVCDVIAIHAQAVSATFIDRDNDSSHYATPLPPESIKRLKKPIPAVRAVHQPYTSTGGKPAESDTAFYTRVSERLRHKQRAVTPWDYEHLILEQFPDIYKVKCLPAGAGTPGVVRLIVIPNIIDRLPADPFAPKASADLLADIQTFIEAHVSASAQVEVQNARFMSVKARFSVRFRRGRDEAHHRKRLNDDLNRFLSPWAYAEGGDIVIGGTLHANTLINFIDGRDYVDYVAGIRLFSSENGREYRPQNMGVSATAPDMVLVAARQHQIEPIGDAGYQPDRNIGIGYMLIELDFIVG